MPPTPTERLRQKLADITHLRGEKDVRGACGDPCYQCEQDKKILALIEEECRRREEEMKVKMIAHILRQLDLLKSANLN